MGKIKSAEQALANWKAGVGSASARKNYVDGINATTESPMAKAATPDALQAYAQACVQSVQDGSRAAALNNTSIAFWKSQSTGAGAMNFANAGTKGETKQRAAYQRLQGIWQQMRQAADQVGGHGLAAAQAKASAALAVLMSAGKRAMTI